MASVKNTVTVNSMTPSQESALVEKITKNVMDAIGADQNGNIDVTAKVTADTSDINKKVSETTTAVEKLRSTMQSAVSYISKGKFSSSGLSNLIKEMTTGKDAVADFNKVLSGKEIEQYDDLLGTLTVNLSKVNELQSKARNIASDVTVGISSDTLETSELEDYKIALESIQEKLSNMGAVSTAARDAIKKINEEISRRDSLYDDYSLTADDLFDEDFADTSELDNLVERIKTRMQEMRDAISSGTASTSDAQNYQAELASLSKQLTDAGGSAEQAGLDFKSLNSELVTYSQQSFQKDVAETEQSTKDAQEAAKAKKEEAAARQENAAAAEKEAESLSKTAAQVDKIVESQVDGQVMSRATTSSYKTGEANVSVTEYEKLNEDTGELEYTSERVEQNFAASRKEAEQITAYIQKAVADLAEINSSTSGLFKDTDSYKAVETSINNLSNGTGSIQEVKDAFSVLKTEVSNVKQELRDGKGLNVFQNAKTDASQMTAQITEVEKAYNNLAVKPQEVGNQIAALKEKNEAFQQQAVSGSSEWVNSYKEIRTEISSLSTTVADLSKSTSTLTLDSLSNSGVKYIQDFTGTVSEAEAKIKEFSDSEGWQSFNVKGIESVDGEVKQLKVTYTEATGAVKEFKMAQADITADGKSITTGLVQTGDVSVVKTAEQAYVEMWDAAIKENEAYNNALAKTDAALQKIASSASDKISNGFYSSTSASLQSQTSVFGNFSSDSINQLREYASEYERIQKELSNSYNTDTGEWLISDQEVAEKKQQLDEILTSFNNLMKQVKTEAGTNNLSKFFADINTKKAQSELDSFSQKLAALGDNVSPELSAAQSQLTTLANEIAKAAETGDWNAITTAVQKFNAELDTANGLLVNMKGSSSGTSWISSMISGLSSGWQTLTKIIGTGFVTRELRSAASEMVSTVKEIDTSMAQLQIVTGATDSEMNEFLESSISLAKELGQSVSDVLDTVQTYSRLGYGLSDASELAEYSSILSNVAGVDIDDATSGLTSVVKGFDLEVSDVEHVSDVLIEVGQNYAVSASEILEAFEKSSAALAATGATFEESAAIIAAGNAAVQDASTVGTALKTKNCLYVQKCA